MTGIEPDNKKQEKESAKSFLCVGRIARFTKCELPGKNSQHGKNIFESITEK